MVSGISQNSFENSSTYQFHYKQYLEMKKAYGEDFTFQGYLDMINVGSDFVMQRLENYIETGNADKGDGIDKNTLSRNHYVDSLTDKNGQMYQTEDKEGYIDVNWDTGAVNYTNDKNTAAKALGLDTENYYFDTIVFGNGTAEITDFVFSGLDDGQDREEYDLNGVYRNIQYAVQEFDPCYILDPSLQNLSDPEYKKALHNWEYLQATATQWMTDSDLAKLAELEPNSAEYKQALIDIILNKLDQTNSFTDHTHVNHSGSTDGSGGTTDGSNGSETENPDYTDYDKDKIISNTSLYGDYLSNSSSSCSSYDSKSKCINEGISNFTTEAKSKLTEVGNALKSELKSELGSAYNDATVSEYIEKAIRSTIKLFTSDVPTLSKDYGDGGNYHTRDTDFTLVYARRKNNSGRITYNNKNLIDYFLQEYDALAANNGKTQTEVNKETEENNKLQTDYKTFYDFNIKSASLGVSNIKSEYTVSMTGGNYKQDAQNNVLTPFASKIVSAVKAKCSNLTESQIKAIVDKAMTNTLSDTSWVTANGNVASGGTYTIDTDKLLDSFADNIRAQIKSAGYKGG